MTLFIVIGLLGVCFFVASLLFGDHDVGGHDHDFGHDHDASDSHGASIFSVFTIAWFMIGFGGAGAIARLNELSLPISNVFGILAGAVCWGLAFSVMHILYKQQGDSTVTLKKLSNITATVSIAIPASGIGKISCSVAGGLDEFMARSMNGQELPVGTAVMVTADSGGIYLVEPVYQTITVQGLTNEGRRS